LGGPNRPLSKILSQSPALGVSREDKAVPLRTARRDQGGSLHFLGTFPGTSPHIRYHTPPPSSQWRHEGLEPPRMSAMRRCEERAHRGRVVSLEALAGSHKMPSQDAGQRNTELHRSNSIKFNVPVHRAAANDIDFRIRTTRGSVCNGLLFGILRSQLAPASINAPITDLCLRFRACCSGVRP
jgi:hypothetical protein